MTDIDWKAKYEGLMARSLQQRFDHRQAVRALEADARRYRFLRSGLSRGDTDLCVTRAQWKQGPIYIVLEEDGADAAIDAAMEHKT